MIPSLPASLPSAEGKEETHPSLLASLPSAEGNEETHPSLLASLPSAEGNEETHPSLLASLPSAEGKEENGSYAKGSGRRDGRQRRAQNRSQRDGMVGAARELRKNPTEAEMVLWEALRRKQAEGMRFRRQRVIGPYIVDFCCLDKKLVVEVDGAHHYEANGMAYDADRTEYLEAHGFRVMRFENADVLHDVDGVVARIVGNPSPALPSAEGKEENDANVAVSGEGRSGRNPSPALPSAEGKEENDANVAVSGEGRSGRNPSPALPSAEGKEETCSGKWPLYSAERKNENDTNVSVSGEGRSVRNPSPALPSAEGKEE